MFKLIVKLSIVEKLSLCEITFLSVFLKIFDLYLKIYTVYISSTISTTYYLLYLTYKLYKSVFLHILTVRINYVI